VPVQPLLHLSVKRPQRKSISGIILKFDTENPAGYRDEQPFFVLQGVDMHGRKRFHIFFKKLFENAQTI
jgi:hypothetical protein